MKQPTSFKTKPKREEEIGRALAVRLGDRLALRRHERGWTQAELAEKLGVETETISRFERGHAMPSLKRLASLAEILDASTGDLMGATSATAGDLAIELRQILQPLSPSQRHALLGAVRLIATEMTSA
ncbi:MAG: helix-turn-helix transcriptional regulator [Brachymonas sp.]|nr:helix-turn-helix transcriptional regulator [Brachymonas sp.]